MIPYPRCKDCYIHTGFFFDYSVLSLKIYEQIDKIKSKYTISLNNNKKSPKNHDESQYNRAVSCSSCFRALYYISSSIQN